jgi:hypothetical protein
VLKELGCEPCAVRTQRLDRDAPLEDLTLCVIVSRSKDDLQQFVDDLRAAIHRRPDDNDLWRNVCGALVMFNTSDGIAVVFERAVGKTPQTLH